MPEVQTTPTPEPESQEYINEMVAKADAQQKVPEGLTEQTEQAERPDWLPEKFQSAEDMAKAYSELESKLGSKNEPDPPEAPAENVTEQQANEMMNEKGLDYTKYEKEFTESGELSADSYKELAESGLPREMVDGYIKGQQSLIEQARQEGFQIAGGEDQFNEMMTWAERNLSPSEIQQYNNMLGNDAEQNRFAIRSLNALWKQENGSAPNLINGRSSSAPTGYGSWEQISEAMRDPRYSKDPAYRQAVERKVMSSNLPG
jgi:hypothetical protein